MAINEIQAKIIPVGEMIPMVAKAAPNIGILVMAFSCVINVTNGTITDTLNASRTAPRNSKTERNRTCFFCFFVSII